MKKVDLWDNMNDSKEKLSYIRCTPSYIKNFENPSEELQLEAVRQNPDLIKHLKNPTFLVQTAAVSVKPSVIKYIKNPSYHIQLLFIRKTKGKTHKIKVRGHTLLTEYKLSDFVEKPDPKILIAFL